MPGSDANDFEKQQGADLIKKTDKYVEGYSSDTQWTYQRAEGPHKVANEIDHEARFTQRYFFKFYDEGWDVTRQVSANFDPIERDWEEPLFKWSSGKW